MYTKIKHWYFVVDNKIVCYGDSRKYTENQAIELILKKYPNAKLATDEDLNKLL